MTREEFAKFAMFLKTVYPRENVLPNEAAMEIWYRMLQHIQSEVAIAVIQKWAATNKWPPTISEIIEEADKITTGEDKSWQEAWQEVLTAIKKFGYIDEATALSSMSQTTRRCVEYIGWRNICESENAVAERANFRNCYEALQKRETEERRLPPALKEALNKITTGECANAVLDSGKPNYQEKLIADGAEPQNKQMVPSAV